MGVKPSPAPLSDPELWTRALNVVTQSINEKIRACREKARETANWEENQDYHRQFAMNARVWELARDMIQDTSL